MMGLFRRTGRPDHLLRHRVEALAHAALGMGPGDMVRVSEVACGAPGCADVSTAVLVMPRGGRTRVARIDKDLASVTPADLAALDFSTQGPGTGQPLATALAALGSKRSRGS